jgi:hypothetical protein
MIAESTHDAGPEQINALIGTNTQLSVERGASGNRRMVKA